MLPARERLDPDGGPAAQRELGLVLEHQLPQLDPAAQLGGEHQAVDRVVVLAGGVDLDGPLGRLRDVERDVGAAQQLVGGGAVVREAGEADAGADVEQDPVDLERLLERGDQPLGDHAAALRAAGAGRQHGELVAAEAGEQVVAPERGAHAVGHVAEEAVAVGMAERVVDGLEVVEVDQQQRQLLVLGARAGPARGRAARAAAAGSAGP